MKKYALPIVVIAVLLSVTIFCFYNQTLPVADTAATQQGRTALVSDSDAVQATLAETVQQTKKSSFIENIQPIADDSLDAVCASYGAVGVQCAVIEDGYVTGSYAYGFADREAGREVTQNTKYRVASLSKLFTNMIFMSLADDGMVALDADIGNYYGFSVRNPSYPDAVITPRMLMTHTASIADGYQFEYSLARESCVPMQQLLTDGSTFLPNMPGTYHSYSNLSNALVGSVCELASGVCFEELAQTRFLKPLKLDGAYEATSVDNAEDIGLLYGGSSTLESQLAAQFSPVLGQTVHLAQGNLTISATDYAQLLCVLLHDGQAADGTQLLHESSVAELLQVQFKNGNESVGLGSFIYENAFDGRTVFGHTGSAYGMYACYVLDPASADGVVVLTSGARYETDPQTGIYSICMDLIQLLFSRSAVK